MCLRLYRTLSHGYRELLHDKSCKIYLKVMNINAINMNCIILSIICMESYHNYALYFCRIFKKMCWFINDIMIAIVIWCRTSRVNFERLRANQRAPIYSRRLINCILPEGQYWPCGCSQPFKIHNWYPAPYCNCNHNVIDEWIHF